MTSHSSNLDPLAGRDLAEYGVARLRDQAFDAVQQLWRRRRAAGVSQKELADIIGRDQGWVSRNLRAPGNWTLRTIGELVQALNGEVEIRVVGLEDPVETPGNFDAYACHDAGPAVVRPTSRTGITLIESPILGQYQISATPVRAATITTESCR